MTATAPFRYDIVGSFLRPAELKEARARHAAGELTDDQLAEVEDRLVADLVAKEHAAGLHAVTDGEFRRRWWHLDWLAGFNGITVYDFETAGFGVKKTMQSTYVSAPLSFDPSHKFLADFRRTKAIAERVIGPDALVKQTIAGPNMVTLDSVVLSRQYAASPVYGSLNELRADLAQTYRDAIRAFYDAGCRYLQLDDTSWGALFSERFRARISEAGYDPDELVDVFGDITEAALEGRPSDMVITTHMCKGNFMSHWLYEGTYETVARRLLGVRGFDGFFLEYDDERSGSFEPLRHLPADTDQRVVLGLVTTKTPELEDADAVRARIAEAAKVVPLERLCLSPQCGFSSTEEGNAVDDATQWKKLALVREVAESVWGDA